jgi:hypothetical protein
MSWNNAKLTASHWLQGLNLPADLHGQIIDLQGLEQKLTSSGKFRTMVLRAAMRELRHRGAKLQKPDFRERERPA